MNNQGDVADQKTMLILASASHTRKRLLTQAGVSVETVPASIDEDSIKSSLLEMGLAPRDLADALADAKAQAVSLVKPDIMVLGADQILVQDQNIFSKASSFSDAKAMLRQLSGNSHQLISAAVIYENNQPVWRDMTTATLTVRHLSGEFIDQYLHRLGDDAFWSVGCYQLEGLGAQLFDAIDGDYFTILGLPMIPILDFLRRRGIVPM